MNPFDPKPMPDELPRLAHRRPALDPDRGDVVCIGFTRALTVATERARRDGGRQVVTVSPYASIFDGGTQMRVQAWR
jgi:hypothetical protein